jgi:predicted transglutaminase-like cysteine proteinase
MFVRGQIARILLFIGLFCSGILAYTCPIWGASKPERNGIEAADTQYQRENMLSDMPLPQRRSFVSDHIDPQPDASKATEIQSQPQNKTEGAESFQLAMLAPNPMHSSEGDSTSKEPFGLPVVTTSLGEFPAKWTELQLRIRADEATLAACSPNISHCPESARRFLSIIELGRIQHGRAQLGWINRAVNLAIKATSDWAQYGYADFWASPLQTLSSGAGDCEDYAIVKYVALRHLGIAPDDLRLLIVRDNMRQAMHAIVAVRYEYEWFILDNRTMAILNADQPRHYNPLFAMDYLGVKAFSTVAARR